MLARLSKMAGKKNKKRAKSKTTDMPHIGSSVIPPAAFAVVPRTPPTPQKPPTAGVGPTPAVFSASLPGRMVAQPQPLADDEPFSDPESSLYDYQQMEEPGYSSVEFGTWPNRQNRYSMSDRERARTPSPGSRRSGRSGHGTDDVQSARGEMYHVLEKTDVNQNDVYAVPNKGKRKSGTFTKEGQDGVSLMGTTHDVRSAMQAVHDLPEFDQDVTLRKTAFKDGHRKSPILSRSLRSSPRRDTDNFSAGKNSPTASQKTKAVVQETMNQTVLSKSSGSVSQRGQSVRKDADSSQDQHEEEEGMSGHHSARVTLMERTKAIEMENYNLQEIVEQQNMELENLRKVASAVKEGDTESATSLLFRKQVEDLKEENEVMKQSVHRLNIELSRKQAVRDTPLLTSQTREFIGLPSKGPVPSWLINKRYLAPLFLAYDERIREKDEVISKFQQDFQNLKHRTEKVVRENHQLAAGGSGGLGMSEWQQLQEQAKLVLEENQILMEQIDVQQHKTNEMFDAHMQEVSRMTKKMSVCESEKVDLERDLEQTKLKFTELRHKHDSLLLTTGGQVAVQDHINTIADIKRSLTEEKDQHFQETETLRNKVKALDDERRSLAVTNTDLVADNKRLQAEIKVLHRAVKRAQHKLVVFQKAIEQSENNEFSTQEQLAHIIQVAEKTAAERDTYAKVAREQQSESKKAMNKVLAESITVGKLEEKLKLYKMKAAVKLNTVADRLKSQDESFNSQKQEYEREIKYLRLLLHEKEAMLHGLEHDKREVEQDLEHMWQAANSENLRIKDTLRKTNRKLREHEGLRDVVEDLDKQDLLNISSDEEQGDL